MPKYRDMFRQMLDEHQDEFNSFADVHARYAENKKKWQNEFNTQGAEILEIIRVWEQRLCGKTEKGDKAVFSSRLAEKFWDEVKAFFPLIDFVGVEIE